MARPLFRPLRPSGGRVLALLIAAGALSACLEAPADTAPAPRILAPAGGEISPADTHPTLLPAPRQTLASWGDITPAEAGRDLATLYRRAERDLLARGFLREDDGEADFPLSPDLLAANFLAVAAMPIRAEDRALGLMRWQDPVRITLTGGSPADRDDIASLTSTISAASGHSVAPSLGQSGNLHVLVLNEAELAGLPALIDRLTPGMGQSARTRLLQMPVSTYCMAVTLPRAGGGIAQALVVIRKELPARLRSACLHEEIGHAMGLTEDHYAVRPSVFNEDGQFAHLTRHDRLLLALLYDPALRAGMTHASLTPLVQARAQALLAP